MLLLLLLLITISENNRILFRPRCSHHSMVTIQLLYVSLCLLLSHSLSMHHFTWRFLPHAPFSYQSFPISVDFRSHDLQQPSLIDTNAGVLLILNVEAGVANRGMPSEACIRHGRTLKQSHQIGVSTILGFVYRRIASYSRNRLLLIITPAVNDNLMTNL